MQLAQAKAGRGVDAREIRGGRTMIVHAVQAEPFLADYFDPEYWLTSNSARPLGAGRGANWRVERASGDWVLRHYRRGGAIARISRDRYLWTGHERSRSITEWRLLARLRQESLPVPEPIAARVTRRGLTYSADLITAFLPATRTLGDMLGDESVSEKVMTAVGHCVRSFHDRAVWHADLNAHNILLDDNGKVYLIDFDRARIRGGNAWKTGNLNRLRRSLDKLSAQYKSEAFSERLWSALTAGYDAPRQ